MKPVKYFDIYQIVLLSVAAFANLMESVLLAIMIFTGEVETSTLFTDLYLVANTSVMKILYTCFGLLFDTAAIWFAARTITYKKRKANEYSLYI